MALLTDNPGCCVMRASAVVPSRRMIGARANVVSDQHQAMRAPGRFRFTLAGGGSVSVAIPRIIRSGEII